MRTDVNLLKMSSRMEEGMIWHYVPYSSVYMLLWHSASVVSIENWQPCSVILHSFSDLISIFIIYLIASMQVI